MKKRTKRIIISIVIALVLIGGGCAGAFYYYFYYPQFHPAKRAYVYIDRDDTIDSIYNKVKSTGNASNFNGFVWMSQLRNYDQNIHTGKYVINPGENVYQVFSRFYRGYQEPINLTIGSVRTVDRLPRSIARQLMIDSTEIASYMNDSLFFTKMGYTQESLPCLFIPETYQVYWDMSVEVLFDRLQKEHNRFWNDERKKKAEAIGFSPEEVCTIASIVEEETNDKAEKPMVAGLYINRLNKGIPLQADPTVKFAVGDFSLKRILNVHLNVESPYNTYKNAGLPPGPIRVPTPAGLDAVLNHTQHDYIYMCAKEDFSGTHNFAATYGEHMRNARKYWDALNKRKIYK